jgi:hypothetical protein
MSTVPWVIFTAFLSFHSRPEPEENDQEARKRILIAQSSDDIADERGEF